VASFPKRSFLLQLPYLLIALISSLLPCIIDTSPSRLYSIVLFGLGRRGRMARSRDAPFGAIGVCGRLAGPMLPPGTFRLGIRVLFHHHKLHFVAPIVENTDDARVVPAVIVLGLSSCHADRVQHRLSRWLLVHRAFLAFLRLGETLTSKIPRSRFRLLLSNNSDLFSGALSPFPGPFPHPLLRCYGPQLTWLRENPFSPFPGDPKALAT